MKTLKTWRIAFFVVLAAFSLASCSNDDDDKITEAQIKQTLSEMNDAYSGQLQFGLRDVPNVRTLLDGCNALSATGLMLSIPLDPIANQVADETLAAKIRAIGTARVYSEYKFTQIDKHGACFVLSPQMVVDEKTAAPLTRTQPVTYTGLTLFFAGNYGGDFFTERGSIDFNLCVERVLIDNVQLEGFKPVFYRFEGTSSTRRPAGETTLEEEARLDLQAQVTPKDKVFLGSGYDVTGAYLSNECLRENVVDLNKMAEDQVTKIGAYSGAGSLVSGVDNAWGFLNGLRVAQGFAQEGEPGDVYFAGTFMDNPLFKEAAERGDDYSFLMYMDRYIVYSHKFVLPSRDVERVLTDRFKQALEEESAERLVERFGTHVLKRTLMGLNILSLYRSGLKANTSDADRFQSSMFRRMNEVYKTIYSVNTSTKATKGGALSVQFHGGNTQRLAADLSQSPLMPSESTEAIANWWSTSGNDLADLSLALLSGDDLVPIYKLIADESKRAEVKRAVKAYIHSHQLK